MINNFLNVSEYAVLGFVGVVFAYLLTSFLLAIGMNKLPRDHGREFAHDGGLSAGKPRGAGFVFILVFVLAALVFGNVDREMTIYLILTVAAMMTGYLDDCAKVSWGELRKGLLDLMIAIMTAVTMVNFNGSDVLIAVTGQVIALPPVLYGILAIVLVWGSINVTNCADGVDGLSGTLTSITLFTIYMIMNSTGTAPEFSYTILLFIACILGYLWFNATPSRLLMGDLKLACNGTFHRDCHHEIGLSVLVPAGSICTDGGRRHRACEGVAAALFAHQDTHQSAHAAA